MMWLSLAWAGTWSEVEALRARGEAVVEPSVAERLELMETARSAFSAGRSAVIAGPAGSGVCFVRAKPAGSLIVTAPHPWFDLHSGELLGMLTDEGAFDASCFATAHRRSTEGSDAAHDIDGGLNALTQGLVGSAVHPFQVQIHGFGATSVEGEMVVAADTPTRARAALLALEEALGVAGKTGEEVPALAATKNVQRRLTAGVSRFVHIELSKDLRERLLADRALRDALVMALESLEDSL